MPSPVSGFQENHITLLRDLIAKEFGRAISSKTDCDKLSELIELRTHKIVSVNTLRRFFDVMRSTSLPSLATLNILSAFCGYIDFFDFQQLEKQKENTSKYDLTIARVNDLHQSLGDTPQFYATLSWLLQFSFRDKNVSFLKDIFDLNVFTGKFDYTQVELKKTLMTLGLELQSDPRMFDLLITNYVDNPIAQALYFECFVDYDFLTIRHHHAIRAYSRTRKDKEAQLFSLCILFLHSFILRDRVRCTELIQQINAIEFSSDLHPFPTGRKMACNILYQAFYLGSVKSTLIKEIFEIERVMPRQGLLGRSIPNYHIVVAEALVWSGLHRHAIAIIELGLQSYSIESDYNTQGILSSLWITYADALLKSSRMEESRNAFKKANATHFDAHMKNFSLMHYYKVGSEIQKDENPKMAISLKRSSLEIANNYNFKFFQNLYS